MKMGERIKERRTLLGMTQEELGEKMGIQKSGVAKWENGRVEALKASTIKQLAEILQCRPSYLMGFDDIQTDNTLNRLLAYYNSLNEQGRKELENYMENTHPKFYEDGDSDV